jgi:hypothetical protein
MSSLHKYLSNQQRLTLVSFIDAATSIPAAAAAAATTAQQVLGVIVLALSHLLASHPHQALWHLSGLAQSLNEARRQAGAKVVHKAIQVRTCVLQ